MDPHNKKENQNPQRKTEQTASNEGESAPLAGNSQNPEAPSEPKIVEGSLQNAVLRTLNSDSSERFTGGTPQQSAPETKHDTPPETPPQRQEKSPDDAIVHTFKDDVQRLVHREKVSLSKIAAMEANRGREENAVEKRGWRTSTIVLFSLILLVVAGILGVGAWYAYTLNTAPVAVVHEQTPTVIFVDARQQVDLTNTTARNLFQTLALVRQQAIFSLGSVVALELSEEVLTQNEQVSRIPVTVAQLLNGGGARVDPTFLQTLDADSLAGLHFLDDDTAPFFIFKSNSYGHTFNGLINWERTMEDDLAPFFSPQAQTGRPAVAQGANTFEDTVIQNLDVRVLQDDTGTTRLLYGFVDRNSAVLTTNPRTFLELVKRLRVAEI